ncbi:hypothetical protein LUTEI9C_70330 [Luteimonas sp. 9C]|nr:hypothetical protein LUTEI9C_70330 [Luteimonas sp. 9C]
MMETPVLRVRKRSDRASFCFAGWPERSETHRSSLRRPVRCDLLPPTLAHGERAFDSRSPGERHLRPVQAIYVRTARNDDRAPGQHLIGSRERALSQRSTPGVRRTRAAWIDPLPALRFIARPARRSTPGVRRTRAAVPRIRVRLTPSDGGWRAGV